MVEEKFNLSRYKELLKLQKNQKSSFLNQELLDYTIILEDQIAYSKKDDFLVSIRQYLSKKISADEFRSKIIQINKEIGAKCDLLLDDFEDLEQFSISKNLKEFSDPIYEISTLCSEFYEAWSFDKTAKSMPEEEFYKLIYKYSIQLQNASFF